MNKIYLFILFALGSGLILNSCKKEATNSTPTELFSADTSCLVNRIKLNGEEEQIEYNAKGFPTKRTFVSLEDGRIVEEFSYSYSGNNAHYENKDGSKKVDYQLDNKGRATQEIISYYDSRGNLDDRAVIWRTFSSEGYLTKEVIKIGNYPEYEELHTWENGNLVKTEYGDGGEIYSSHNFEYYLDKNNHLESIHSRLNFKGTAPKNLRKRELNGETGRELKSFVYEFDATGKPKSETTTDSAIPATFTTSFSYTCP